MFYINELILRLKYFLFSFVFTLLICYNNKNFLIFMLTQSVTKYTYENKINIDHFIYTHPLELFTVQVLLILYFSFLFIFPYIFWIFFDFLKSSLCKNEYYKTVKVFILLFSIIIVFNFLSTFYLFPTIWFFFNTFNNSLNLENISSFFLELRIYEYFMFVINFIFTINISIILILIFSFLFLSYGLNFFLYWKKLFIFLNMVFATLLSPPDVYNQLLIFFFLVLVFEFLILIYIFISKFYKYLKLKR